MGLLKNIRSSSVPDLELVEQFKHSGNLELLGDLYNRYLDMIYGVCLKYLKQPEDAQDSTILIFEELNEKLRKHEVQNFKSWLYTLAKNHCLMLLRSRKKTTEVKIDVELMHSAEDLHLDGVLEKEEYFNQLEHCMEQLPQDQRNSIRMFYLEGRCYNEIAELTGIEWNKIRSYIQNGRRNLKICIEKQKAIANNERAI